MVLAGLLGRRRLFGVVHVRRYGNPSDKEHPLPQLRSLRESCNLATALEGMRTMNTNKSPEMVVHDYLVEKYGQVNNTITHDSVQALREAGMLATGSTSCLQEVTDEQVDAAAEALHTAHGHTDTTLSEHLSGYRGAMRDEARLALEAARQCSLQKPVH